MSCIFWINFVLVDFNTELFNPSFPNNFFAPSSPMFEVFELDLLSIAMLNQLTLLTPFLGAISDFLQQFNYSYDSSTNNAAEPDLF